jgi:hypothetical protein
VIALFFLGRDFNGLPKNCVSIIDLRQEAKDREESTPPLAIWKRPDTPDLRGIRMALDTRESLFTKFRGSVPQALYHTTQLGEPLQAADIGVAGVDFLVDVVGK